MCEEIDKKSWKIVEPWGTYLLAPPWFWKKKLKSCEDKYVPGKLAASCPVVVYISRKKKKKKKKNGVCVSGALSLNFRPVYKRAEGFACCAGRLFTSEHEAPSIKKKKKRKKKKKGGGGGGGGG